MKVLFLCSHGGAKSVIAAAYFNRLAKDYALPYTADAAAAEDPYEGVPEAVSGFLYQDGFDVRGFTPRSVAERDISEAMRTVAIGCELAGAQVERWNDVPAASDDLEGSVSAIRRHIEVLIEELRGRS